MKTYHTLEQRQAAGLVACLSSGPTLKQRSDAPKKKYACKQCGHTNGSKQELWEHTRKHIPKEKLLACTECQFVTKYKHHLQYHTSIHTGSKQFKCSKCEYACANNSTLNSHMK